MTVYNWSSSVLLPFKATVLDCTMTKYTQLRYFSHVSTKKVPGKI